MVPNLKSYIAALAAEVLPAFRRGVLAMTALAYILIVGAYILVGGNFALSTFQLWTGALAIAIAEVLIVLPYRLWKSNVTEINALKAIDYSGPDWTIGELFSHLMPEGMPYDLEKIGRDVLDKLSTARLTAWGRTEPGRPLQLISFIFWSKAELTYLFLSPDHDEEVHAKEADRLLVRMESFCDIRVNKGTALRLWPR
jgi:hypothetical protein